MFTFIKKWGEEYRCAEKEVRHSSDEETLSEVLADFEQFLRGCGYYFEGHLEIISEDDDECSA